MLLLLLRRGCAQAVSHVSYGRQRPELLAVQRAAAGGGRSAAPSIEAAQRARQVVAMLLHVCGLRVRPAAGRMHKRGISQALGQPAHAESVSLGAGHLQLPTAPPSSCSN